MQIRNSPRKYQALAEKRPLNRSPSGITSYVELRGRQERPFGKSYPSFITTSADRVLILVSVARSTKAHQT